MTRRPIKYLLSLFAAGVLYFASPLYADTVYVGPHGRQGAAGTQERPLATLQEGVDRCGPGDQCVVLAATYREAVRLSKSGLPGKPIVIRAVGTMPWKNASAMERMTASSCSAFIGGAHRWMRE